MGKIKEIIAIIFGIKKEIERLRRELDEKSSEIVGLRKELDVSEIGGLRRELEKIRNRERVIKEMLSGRLVNSNFDIEKIESFVFEKFIPFIDKTNLYENEFKVFEELRKGYNYYETIVKKPWLKGKTVISLLGKFSAGKSSIVNSILGQKLLPVEVTPTTAIPTYISFTPRNEIFCKIEDADGDIREISGNILQDIKHTNFKDFPLSSIINCIVIEYNNENLKDKSILDTPGYDSLHDKDKKKSIQAIKSSDVVFWVMDINDGAIMSDAIKFIKDKINKPLYLIINKADSKSPKEREKTFKEVNELLKKEEIKCKDCILYSNKNTEEFKECKRKLADIIKNIEVECKRDYKDLISERIDELFRIIGDNICKHQNDYSERKRFERYRDELRVIEEEFKKLKYFLDY